MKLAVGIDHGLRGIVTCPQCPGFMECCPQAVGIFARGRRVACYSRGAEKTLRKEIDTLVHEVHDLRFDIVSRGGARNEPRRCAWNEILVKIGGRNRDGDTVLGGRKHFTDGAYRYIDLARCRVLEMADIIEVRSILEEQRIRRTGTGSFRLR